MVKGIGVLALFSSAICTHECMVTPHLCRSFASVTMYLLPVDPSTANLKRSPTSMRSDWCLSHEQDREHIV